MTYIVQAWVKGSPNIAPIAVLETRMVTVADQIAKLWRKDWRVERFAREEDQCVPSRSS